MDQNGPNIHPDWSRLSLVASITTQLNMTSSFADESTESILPDQKRREAAS